MIWDIDGILHGSKLRPNEFTAIGMNDYGCSVPGIWNPEC